MPLGKNLTQKIYVGAGGRWVVWCDLPGRQNAQGDNVNILNKAN